MPIPLLWIIGGIITAGVGAAAVAGSDDDEDQVDREAAERAEAERRRRQREREQARSRFVAMRNDEIIAFAKVHGLSVDEERLRNARADSTLPRRLLFEAIEKKTAQTAASCPDEEHLLETMEHDRVAIARLLAPRLQAKEARND